MLNCLLSVSRKCLKIVHSERRPVTLGDAQMACAADNSRLVTVRSCQDVDTLLTEVYDQFLKDDQAYFLGMFAFSDTANFSHMNWRNLSTIDS